MARNALIAFLLFLTVIPNAGGEPKSGSATATAQEFFHLNALLPTLTPDHDRPIKLKLIAALGKSKELDWKTIEDYFDQAVFDRFADENKVITIDAMEREVRERTPASRKDMLPKVRQHADLLSMQFDLIERHHQEAAGKLAAWIAKNYEKGKPLGVIIICTRNTRRSMLGATMGNIAAAYHGLTDLHFFSGGTNPEAFNPRSIATLKEIGVEIEATGEKATSGSEGTPNPIYSVKWGKGLETREFSKKFTDERNPKTNFAAVLVCSEADSACPQVTGAALRLPVPYVDPKAFDGALFEAGKYAERRDDVGRFMLNVALQARRRLEAESKPK